MVPSDLKNNAPQSTNTLDLELISNNLLINKQPYNCLFNCHFVHCFTKEEWRQDSYTNKT